MKKIILFLLVIFSVSMYAEEKNGIVYVKLNGTGDGTSWANAMGDIQSAINTARADKAARKDVWVASGNYTISSSIVMSDSISLYGSFAGTETAVDQRAKSASGKPWEFTNATTLTGNNCRLIETASNFDMVTIVDGFILTNGNGVGGTLNKSGGAAVVRNKMVIQNSVIQNSTALDGAGGGLNMTGGTVKNSWIYKNTQTTNANGGGGIYINTASGNETIIENCTIEGNSSTIRGGGLNVQGAGFTKMIGLKVFNNIAEGKQGGAMYQNSATNSMINSLIYNNTGTNAIQLRGSLLNSTIVNNVGGVYMGESTAAIEFSNNIIWGCITETGGTSATSLTGANNPKFTVHNNATYNPIANTSWIIENNIQFSSNNSNGDVENPAAGTVGSGPKFTKVSTFKGIASADEEILILDSVNWSLQLGSPCIDAGKTLAAVTTDILGLTRPQGTAYEIGAYEKDPATGLSNNEFIYSVYSRDKQIVISGFEHPVKVAVYSVSGQTIYTKTISGSSIEIPVQKGIYIVRVDNAAKKVLVK